MQGRGRIQLRELPEDVDVEAALAELDDRARRLMVQIGDTTERIGEELDRARQEIVALGDRADAAVGRLEEQDRRVAVGGIRWEALGLFLVSVGVLLHGVAARGHQ